MKDMKEYMSIFNKYVKGFDLKNKNIMRKFHHTYRVVEHANDIAVSLKLNDDDIVLAKLCALFHDIARFSQITQYNTFIDSKSFDHGDKGYEIVKEFIEEISDDKDTSAALSRRVITNGRYDTSKVGTYTIDVYCTDSDKNQSNHVTFTLHVN